RRLRPPARPRCAARRPRLHRDRPRRAPRPAIDSPTPHEIIAGPPVPRGGMCERLKQAVLKTAVRETVPGGRIPLPPPTSAKRSLRSRLRLASQPPDTAAPASAPAEVVHRSCERSERLAKVD